MPVITHHAIVLASRSSIRAQMLSHVGITVEIMPSTVNEDAIRAQMKGAPFAEQALRLACAKAESVSRVLAKSYVIGADQICSLGNEILTKPGNKDNARLQLQRLRGVEHQQHSALAVYFGGEKLFQAVDTARLAMRALSDEEIGIYLELDKPYDSCGAYKYESFGAHLFREVQGDAETIFGMPLLPLMAWLHEKSIISLSL